MLVAHDPPVRSPWARQRAREQGEFRLPSLTFLVLARRPGAQVRAGRRIRTAANTAARGRPRQSRPRAWVGLGQLNEIAVNRALRRLWRVLPSSPRCGICGAPFAGPGRWIVRPLGFAPSREPNRLCCLRRVLAAWGMKMQAGIRFADLRGFSAASMRAIQRRPRWCCAASTAAPKMFYSPTR